MQPILITVALFIAVAAPGAVLANAELAQHKQCMQCHAVDRHVIGPSFQTIKAIYSRMDNPEKRLIEVMREGNDANLGPHWGRARMPNGSERPLINDEEARQLARWILS